jgi:hypothetical protein
MTIPVTPSSKVAAIGALAASHRLRRGLLRLSLGLIVGGFVLGILSPLFLQGDQAAIGAIPGMFVAMFGIFGMLFWIIGSFLGWLARITITDAREEFGVRKEIEPRDRGRWSY